MRGTAWAAPANAGAGVKIGIIDTGIDQTHAAFQDPALTVPDGYPKGDAAFTNNKVIVARSYVDKLAPGDGTSDYSRPDDLSPRDRSGHGTAVAMIAAGATNTGPLATITGIAPKAWLGSYKVFGTPGVNDYADPVIPQALEQAFNDGMDIVVMPFGVQPAFQAQVCPNNDCDQDKFNMEQAVQNAMDRGMTVVISAGNDGQQGSSSPTLNTINSPGTVPAAITVGSSSNMHVFYATVNANGGNINALFGDAPMPAQALTAPLRDVAQIGKDSLACTALPAGSLTGAIALIQRGTCDFNAKINNAQAAGAVGAIVYQPSGKRLARPDARPGGYRHPRGDDRRCRWRRAAKLRPGDAGHAGDDRSHDRLAIHHGGRGSGGLVPRTGHRRFLDQAGTGGGGRGDLYRDAKFGSERRSLQRDGLHRRQRQQLRRGHGGRSRRAGQAEQSRISTRADQIRAGQYRDAERNR